MIQTDTFHVPPSHSSHSPHSGQPPPGSRYPQNSELALALYLLRIYWNEALHPQSPRQLDERLQGNLKKKTYPETEKNKRTVPNRSVSTTLFIDQPYWVHNQQFLRWDTGKPLSKINRWNRFKPTSSMRQATSKTQEVKASSFAVRDLSGLYRNFRYMVTQHNWLVVSTPLKNSNQIGNLPQVGMKIKMFETTTYR